MKLAIAATSFYTNRNTQPFAHRIAAISAEARIAMATAMVHMTLVGKAVEAVAVHWK